MKKNRTVLLFLSIITSTIVAQPKKYFTCIERGDSLYKAGQFLQSAQMYSAAFISFRGKSLPNDLYNAARSWAMASQPDSAFIHLERLVYKARYSAYFRLNAEVDFNSLHNSIRWQNLMDTVKAIHEANEIKIAERKKLSEKLYEPELANQLDSIYKADQFYRKQLSETEKRYGNNSEEMKRLWTEIKFHDSINLIKVAHILDTRGWLGPEVVHSGSNTLFLVIQHSNLNAQLKYLPMMREAVKNKKLEGSSLAMLEDRILLGQGKKQIYGTQISRDPVTGKRYVGPLVDPDNVDKRREEVGLCPIADYISNWDLVWDVETYKKEMTEREK
jgi:hypothetical protein